MKKYSLYLLTACFAMLSSVGLTSCSDDNDVNANDVLAVKSVLPTKVIEGQVVTITGTGLEKATSVVFPGNVVVSDINKVGNGYITVVTPAGVAADGGEVVVNANGESAKSTFSLTVGQPEASRVAPLDQVIKINECLEVYGNDLQFISRAYFPGKDGEDIVVSAENFRRKSNGALYIYSPMGIAEGPAVITLEDCGGKKYVLPEVTLSEEVSSGEAVPKGETYTEVWKGEVYIYDWAVWEYISTEQLNIDGIALREGQMMRLTFDNPDGASVCVCDAGWGQPNVDGEGHNSIWVVKGETQIEFPISQGMVETIKNGGGIIVGGGNFTLKSIEIFKEYPVLWSGEYTTGWWWYLPASELDLSNVELEAGQTIRFTFTHHDEPQTFCLCDGWWGAPFIREGGESKNNITLDGGEDFLEFEVSEDMAKTMKGDETALIIGGDITITKIQIKTF